MPLKGAKKNYNKKYYMENKEMIADKKNADYQEHLEKKSVDSAEQSCESCKKDRRRVAMTVLHVSVRLSLLFSFRNLQQLMPLNVQEMHTLIQY